MKLRLSLLLLVTISEFGTAACPPPYTASGSASAYQVGQSTGMCSVANVDGETAAISGARWNNSVHCGECLSVTGPVATTIVRITDECPDCAESRLDLSQAAFKKITGADDNIFDITWQRVDCPVNGGLALQFIGSNPYYLKMLGTQTNQAVASIEVQNPGDSSWSPMTRQDDGTFTYLPTGMLRTPLPFRLTSESGQVLPVTLTGSFPQGDQTYPTNQQFEGCTDRLFASDFGSTN